VVFRKKLFIEKCPFCVRRCVRSHILPAQINVLCLIQKEAILMAGKIVQTLNCRALQEPANAIMRPATSAPSQLAREIAPVRICAARPAC
jgi:hypothetical protein